MDIEGIIGNYKDFDELKVFCAAQYKQIILLNKRIKDLEEKNITLTKSSREELRNNVVPVESHPLNPSVKVLDDAKTISQVQLRMLKEIAFDRELTLEEAKRVEIFNRIMNDVPPEKKNTIKADMKVLKEAELLSLVENGSNE